MTARPRKEGRGQGRGLLASIKAVDIVAKPRLLNSMQEDCPSLGPPPKALCPRVWDPKGRARPGCEYSCDDVVGCPRVWDPKGRARPAHARRRFRRRSSGAGSKGHLAGAGHRRGASPHRDACGLADGVARNSGPAGRLGPLERGRRQWPDGARRPELAAALMLRPRLVQTAPDSGGAARSFRSSVENSVRRQL